MLVSCCCWCCGCCTLPPKYGLFDAIGERAALKYGDLLVFAGWLPVDGGNGMNGIQWMNQREQVVGWPNHTTKHTNQCGQQKMLDILQDRLAETLDLQHDLYVIVAQFTQTLHVRGGLQLQVEQFAVEEQPRIAHGPRQRHTARIVCHRSGLHALHEQRAEIDAAQVDARQLVGERIGES